jgi:hypothetical protein
MHTKLFGALHRFEIGGLHGCKEEIEMVREMMGDRYI